MSTSHSNYRSAFLRVSIACGALDSQKYQDYARHATQLSTAKLRLWPPVDRIRIRFNQTFARSRAVSSGRQSTGLLIQGAATSDNDQILTAFTQDRQARNLSPNTIRFYLEKLSVVRRVTDDWPLLTLTKANIQHILTSLPCSPGGKHAYLRTLRAFYAWAEESGLIAGSPCHKLQIKVPRPLRHVVALEAISPLLSACATLRDRLIVSMLADTGLRLSELASIRLGDVNPGSQTIKVWGKGAKQRVVRFGPSTASLLDQYVDQSTIGATLLGLTPRGISVMLYRLGKATGIRCNAHAFRRTFACESVRNGLNLFYVQSLL